MSDPFTVPAQNPEDEYEFVRMPDGSIRAIQKSLVKDAELPATSKSEAPKVAVAEVPIRHFYVHLANGDVERVAEEDLPQCAGGDAVHGYWQKNGKVFQVIGVYPVEDPAE